MVRMFFKSVQPKWVEGSLYYAIELEVDSLPPRMTFQISLEVEAYRGVIQQQSVHNRAEDTGMLRMLNQFTVRLLAHPG